VAVSCEHGYKPTGSKKRQGISLLAEGLSASQEGLYFMELVACIQDILSCWTNDINRNMLKSAATCKSCDRTKPQFLYRANPLANWR